MINKKGFSLVEIIIAIALMGSLLAVYINKLSFPDKGAEKISLMLVEGFVTIEDQYLRYLKDNNTTPIGLTDTTFVPAYFSIPMVPSGFNPVYGTNGYLLAQKSGQVSPNNGEYITVMVKVKNSTDMKWLGIVETTTRIPTMKMYYNIAAGAVNNMAPPAGSTDVYVTYWISRY